MSDPRARLSGLEARIERVAVDPATIKAPWTRLVRPILRSLGWQPKVRVAAIERLLDGLSGEIEVDLATLVGPALDELEADVDGVERACVVNGRASVAHAAWLRRLFEVVSRATFAVERSDEEQRVAGAVDRVAILPPLAVRGEELEARRAAQGEPDEPLTTSPSGERLTNLQLAAIDHLVDAARGERRFLARRRRLLEAARQALLEASAALPLVRDGVEERRGWIAAEIVRIDRLEAAGVAPEVGLLHQAKGALARGDKQRLHALLAAMGGMALRTGDASATRIDAALDRLSGGADLTSDEARRASVLRSSDEILGPAVVAAVKEAYVKGRAEAPAAIEDIPAMFHAEALAYFGEANEAETLAATLAVDGAFEVGGTLSPVRAVEVETRVSLVNHPTQELVLDTARDVADLPEAVVDDPRTILLSLAAGRLLTRKYVRYDRTRRARTKLVGEARVYLLDGSTSMVGPRARMRDAILLAELCTLMRRLSVRDRSTQVTLFYRYFDTKVGPVTRVATPAEALGAVGDVVGTLRTGGTNIHDALCESFTLLRDARAKDPDLARAQIVLVTDGDAPILEAELEVARRGLDDLPIGVSVIALGQENELLRALVSRQRAAGARAFYHFIPDGALNRLVSGEIDDGRVIHLPEAEGDARRTRAEVATALGRELGGILDELAELDRKRDLDAVERAAAERRSSLELGVELDGAAAQREAADRDLRALERRFDRWFPPVDAASPPVSAVDDDDRDAALVVLSTVAEVVEVLGGSELARRAEAVDTLERLLPDAGLSPARYRQALFASPATLAAPLVAVRALVSTVTRR